MERGVGGKGGEGRRDGLSPEGTTVVDHPHSSLVRLLMELRTHYPEIRRLGMF